LATGLGLGAIGLLVPAGAVGSIAGTLLAGAGTVSGTLGVALTLGSVLPPLWTGVVAGMAGLRVALGVNYAMVLLLLFLARYLGRSDSRAAPYLLPGTEQ